MTSTTYIHRKSGIRYGKSRLNAISEIVDKEVMLEALNISLGAEQ